MITIRFFLGLSLISSLGSLFTITTHTREKRREERGGEGRRRGEERGGGEGREEQ